MKIETNKGFKKKMIISGLLSTFFGVSLSTGLPILGEAILASATIGGTGIASTTFSTTVGGVFAGPWGIAIGIMVGLSISIGTLIINSFNKEKRYKKGLEQFKEDIIKKFEECENDFLENYTLYKNQFLKGLAIKIQIIVKDINTVDKKKWEEIRSNYIQKKNKIMKKITSLNLGK